MEAYLFFFWYIYGAGKVYVNGKRVNKAGTPVSDKAVVEIMAEIQKYVCRWLFSETPILHFSNYISEMFKVDFNVTFADPEEDIS